MPLLGLYELTRVTVHLKAILADVSVPTCIIQATHDHVVDPQSAEMAFERLGIDDKEMHWVESERHGILNEDVGDTHSHVLNFLARVLGKR